MIFSCFPVNSTFNVSVLPDFVIYIVGYYKILRILSLKHLLVCWQTSKTVQEHLACLTEKKKDVCMCANLIHVFQKLSETFTAHNDFIISIVSLWNVMLIRSIICSLSGVYYTFYYEIVCLGICYPKFSSGTWAAFPHNGKIHMFGLSDHRAIES